MYLLLLDYLILYKNPSVPDLYSIIGIISILMVSSKGFNITVTHNLRHLVILNLFLITSNP